MCSKIQQSNVYSMDIVIYMHALIYWEMNMRDSILWIKNLRRDMLCIMYYVYVLKKKPR